MSENRLYVIYAPGGGSRWRTDGISLRAISLSTDAAPATLAQITGAPERVPVARSPADLEAVYRRVAGGIVCR